MRVENVFFCMKIAFEMTDVFALKISNTHYEQQLIYKLKAPFQGVVMHW